MEVHCHLPGKIETQVCHSLFVMQSKDYISHELLSTASASFPMSYECLVLCFQHLTSTLGFIVAYILGFQTILFPFVVLLNT